jgi:hypothetical protein
MAVEFPPSLGARVADEIRAAQAPQYQHDGSLSAQFMFYTDTDRTWTGPTGPDGMIHMHSRNFSLHGDREAWAAFARDITRQLVTDAVDGPDAA